MNINKIPISTLFHRYIGHLIVFGLMVGGYIYNFKFIQIGIPALGLAKIHLSPSVVGDFMALLAILTAIIAIAWGSQLGKLHWDINRKFDVIFLVTFIQMLLTIWAPFIENQLIFTIWIIFTSLTLGIGIPLTFPLIFEIIPTKLRGLIAGFIAGIAFFAANISLFQWSIETLTLESLLLMIPALGILLVLRVFGLLKKWLPTKTDYSNHIGRFTTHSRSGILILMFLIFFIDSSGFLRIISPASSIVNLTWQGPLETRIILATVHLLTGIGAGFLYSKTNEWTIGLISLGLFVVADVLFSLYALTMDFAQLITVASLYCATVSIYTVNNFAIWADSSSQENAAKNSALGIGIGGWFSSFISTFLVYQFSGVVPFDINLIIPAIIAGTAFVVFSLILKTKRQILVGQPISSKDVP